MCVCLLYASEGDSISVPKIPLTFSIAKISLVNNIFKIFKNHETFKTPDHDVL